MARAFHLKISIILKEHKMNYSGPYHGADRTFEVSAKELIESMGEKEKTIDLSQLPYISPHRKKNPGWANIEKANKERTRERLKRELEELEDA